LGFCQPRLNEGGKGAVKRPFGGAGIAIVAILAPKAIGSSGKVASSVENKLKSWQAWRDSNPVRPLIPHNLLILRNGRSAKNGQNATLRYTAGTQPPNPGESHFLFD
jgi:hypothetical protein